MIKLYLAFASFCSTLIAPIVNLAARIYIGWVFFNSGLLKVEDFDETLESFGPDGDFALPFLSGDVAAYMATAGELILPALLFIGLFTRFAAAGLLVMAVVIEFWVFPGTQLHYYWMLVLGFIMGQGGHVFSFDYWFLKDKIRF